MGNDQFLEFRETNPSTNTFLSIKPLKERRINFPRQIHGKLPPQAGQDPEEIHYNQKVGICILGSAFTNMEHNTQT